MSKRNFILLIILLAVVILSFFGFLFWRKGPAGPGEGTNFLSQFNPFGGRTTTPNTNPPPVDVSGGGTSGEESSVSFLKVSSVPVAGYTVFMKERFKEVAVPVPSEDETPPEKATPPQTEFVPALRYVDRATGNIYQTFADKIEERKFSGTVIPKVYEALFGSGGSSVIMRYLKGDGVTIETFVGTLPEEVLGGDVSGEYEVRGTLLPANITDISISPDGSSAFYLFNAGETSLGNVFQFKTGSKTQIFDSAFNEWLSSWPGAKTITLATKPSYAATGYVYKLDTAARSFIQHFGGVRGLTALLSPNTSMLLYGDNTLALSIYHSDTKISESLGVRTLPEKCVWSKESTTIYCAVPELIVGTTYPDSWYQGEVSFDDQIWKIDVSTGTASIIFDPATAPSGESLDGIKPALDPEERYLFFVNKKDSFLWKLDLIKS